MSKRRYSTGNSKSAQAISASGPGEVRLIAGQYRGRCLSVPHLDGLRPTGNRVRETLFNWLQNDVAGARCLDAFAGSGALGFEAASRYAEAVVLVEPHAAAAAQLERSRHGLNAKTVEIVKMSFESFSATQPEPFDLVFVDPPFQDTDYRALLAQIDKVLTPSAVVYVECPKRMSDADAATPSHWHLSRDKCFGEVRARLYRIGT